MSEDIEAYIFFAFVGVGLIMLGVRTFRAYRAGQKDAEREKRRRRKREGPLP